jgi:hypothetical protein
MDAIENGGRLSASDYRRSVLYSTDGRWFFDMAGLLRLDSTHVGTILIELV